MKFTLSTLALIFVFLTSITQSQNVTGQWSGVAQDGVEETQLVLTIGDTQNGLFASMALPDIEVTGWPAQSVQQTNNTLTVIFPSDSGPQEMALSFEGETMTGTWRENRFETAASVNLTRRENVSPAKEKRILVEGPTGKLGASLIVPDCSNDCPAVVFLHGSGPQPRDASRFAALTLAEHGIASIIYDKRGVGESGGNLEGVSFHDLAADAIAIADVLRNQPGISYVGFFGHSQGGWIAPLAGSQWEHTAFVITSAGPAVPPSREGEWEVVRRLRAAGLSEEVEQKARGIIQLWHQGVRSGDWSAFDTSLNDVKAEPWYDTADFSVFMDRPNAAFVHSYRAFMDYDPIPALSSLSVPMLAILTPDDESIDAVETETILRGLQNRGNDIEIKLYPVYDHRMRRLGTEGNPIRWPEHPSDYFSNQARFIQSISC